MKAPLIVSGLIVNYNGSFRASVVIDRNTGLISEIRDYTPHGDIVGKNLLVFPGMIDIHTHCRGCPSGKHDHKETFRTAGRAALNGGVVALADMANKPILPKDRGTYCDLLAIARDCQVPVLPYAAVTKDSRPLQIKVPYKCFLGESFGDLRFDTFEEAATALPHYRGQNLSDHCDDNVILEQHKDELLHELRRPASSEISGIRMAIKLAAENDIQLKIVHCSTAEGIKLIREARENGVKISAEGTHHHCYFDWSDLTDESRPRLQMNPPLRPVTDRVAVLDALLQGDLDFLASDHAPHLESERPVSGITGLDIYGPLTTWLIRHQGFRPEDVARVACYNPGWWFNKFLGIPHHIPKDLGFGFGRIAQDFIGSLTVIDMDAPTTVTKEMLKTKCGWSPYEGCYFPGSVAYTVVNGEILNDRGTIAD
jgi:dihydroorotase